jgi:predicted RNA-binding Zn-ribbon protein involved in translation (DUF1610 family)
MRASSIPYLECRNVDCDHTIWLPRSSRLGKSPHQQDSDSRSFETYVCPQCAHVYDYRDLSVLWNPDPSQAPDNLGELFAVGLVFDCETENCGTRTIIRKTTREHLDCSRLSLASLSTASTRSGLHTTPQQKKRAIRRLG